MLSEKSLIKGSCIYCGTSDGLTKDHVPPKCLFPKPRGPQITVPACMACNQSFKKDDEYFAMAVAVEAYVDHPSALQVWEQSLRPMILQGQGLQRMLSDSILEGEVVTPAGVHLPDRRAIRFKKNRILRVVARIVRGLLWHHYKVKPSANAVFEIHRNPTLNNQIADFINSMTRLSWVGDDIFRYRHSLVEGDPDGSIWCLQFYCYSELLVLVFRNACTPPTTNPGAAES